MRSLSQKTEEVSQKIENLNNIKTELEALLPDISANANLSIPARLQ
jgi:hypothetical protein